MNQVCRTSVFLFLFGSVGLTTACQTLPITPAQAKTSTRISQITSRYLPEISGLAASTYENRGYWAVNDSGNPAEIYLLNPQLQLSKRVRLNIKNRDWEDLSSFRYAEEGWILIADTGDNLRRHTDYFLYFFREKSLLNSAGQAVNADHIIRFRFEDGPQDCEAIAVDENTGSIILFSKSEERTFVYRLPLKLTPNDKQVTAERIATLAQFPGRNGNHLLEALSGINFDSPTSAEISSDGKNGFILTYRDIWWYKREPGQSWRQAFSSRASLLSSHSLRQAEALTLDTLRKRVIVTTEKLPASVLEFAY